MRWPVPWISLIFMGTLPIIASPYVVPEVVVYADGSWKSTHEKLVLMLAGLDCFSRVVGVFPFIAYIAAIAFPWDAPAM